MPTHVNSASRLHTLLVKTTTLNPDTTTVQIWRQVFGISPASAKAIVVADLVGKMYREAEFAHNKMRATPYTPGQYEPVFANLYKALSVDNLSSSWQTYRQYLTESTLNMLSLFSELLAHEEEPLSAEELDKLLQRLSALLEEVSSSDLPADVKSFIIRHITIIQEAILAYPIQGQKAFADALMRASADFGLNQQLIRAHEEDTEFESRWNQIAYVWNYIKERTTDVETLVKIVGGLALADKLLRPLLPG